jgi:phosphate transport system permease protein
MDSFIEQGVYRTNVQARHQRGQRYRLFYLGSLIFALIALIVLVITIINQSFGLVAVAYSIDPDSLSSQPLEELDEAALATLLATTDARNENASRNRMIVYLRDRLSAVAPEGFTSTATGEALKGRILPAGVEAKLVKDLTLAELNEIAALNFSQAELINLLNTDILKAEVEESWTLFDSVFNREQIERAVDDKYSGAELRWRSWLNPAFLSSQLSNVPAESGLLPALMGTLFLLLFTMSFALPLGIGAAIYLEEYASDSFLNRVIETNIRNLAGVPSIIYGMLGLAIFVNALRPFTSGACFGLAEGYFTLEPLLTGKCFDGSYASNLNGRTIISAAFTMALLILPLIIVNAQEALRAVPSTIREASYGLGATRWQTISRQVLPAATPGIMTGTILAMARAIGETAPLIVVGAATYISTNPSGPFSKFTAMPILIFDWTGQPDPQYRNIAAAGIIVLLVLLLTLNSVAIIIRNRASSRRL